MKKVAIKIVSLEGIRTLRDATGSVLETIPAAEQEALDKVIAEAEHYSITPTTFNERVFEESLDDTLFRNKYNFREAEVTRFGINAASSKIMSSINEDSIKIFDETNRAASTAKSGAYKPDDAKKIPLASLEKELLNKAISHLLESDIRTVLVDILARVNSGTDNTNGAVKIKGGVPEIHTVVLYKNPSVSTTNTTEATSATSTSVTATTSNTSENVQILVIDPSSFLFSSHLSNFNTQRDKTLDTAAALEADVETASSASAATTNTILPHFTIKTIHKGLQIYKPAGSIGPRPDQYRDCIDVAVKIALGFNQIQDWCLLDKM